MKVKKILISQPKPSTEKSPYLDIAEKHKVELDFCQFIQVEGVSGKEFRLNRINILDFTAVIFTSRTSIDHFFRICEELRVQVPDTMKYFCASESIAVYLQKYIVYRKRKIFFGEKKIDDMVDVLIKNRDEKFLVPVSDIHNDEIPELLDKHNISNTAVSFYKTICAETKHLDLSRYDMLVFYSPAGIDSLFKNFPNFIQGDVYLATFGPNTAKAADEKNLRVDLRVPSPEFPSMTMAIDQFITDLSKRSGK